VTPKTTRSLTRIVAAAAILTLATSAQGETFQSAIRTPDRIFLLSFAGDVWTVNEAGLVARALRFTMPGGEPFRWQKQPRSFARLGAAWLVADGSDHLTRFDTGGRFAGRVPLPARVSTIASGGGVLWAVDVFATRSSVQLLRSTDGVHFSRFDSSAKPRAFATPGENLLIIAAADRGTIYANRIIGPPIVTRALPNGQASVLTVAYSRSKQRAALASVDGPLDDLTHYSLPIRDLLPLHEERLAVLRNREDVRTPSGSLETIRGQRADVYDAEGRHLKTATFPHPVHWLFDPTESSIKGVDREGRVATAAWGAPIPGGIIER
jgi:hypothetical protein